MNRLVDASKAVSHGLQRSLGKRKAEVSPRKNKDTKRSALGDISNNAKKHKGAVTFKANGNKIEKVLTRAQSKGTGADANDLNAAIKNFNIKVQRAKRSSNNSKIPFPVKKAETETVEEFKRVTRQSSGLKEEKKTCTEKNVEPEESLYVTTLQSFSDDDSLFVSANTSAASLKVQEKQKNGIPDGVVDFDKECGDDAFQMGIYAESIFKYYKKRELLFPVPKYLETKQPEINKNMRSILVDWMVEVQESFELNHETLYLAVKLVDLFLSKTLMSREKLQLVGTTALYISAKYDERCPPIIDDFCYICDDAYCQRDVLKMEENMLKVLQFDIGIPLSYRFLRRYSRCAKLDMEILTLARFILETSLMEYDFIDVRDSLMAAAVLNLALVLKNVPEPWSPTLQYYSGYSKEELSDLTKRVLASMKALKQPHLKTIRSKYSHRVFYEVGKTNFPDQITL